MPYPIEIKQLEKIQIATLGFQGLVTKANKQFPTLFKSIKGNANGAPFFAYYEIDQNSKIGKIDLCVPTEETPTNNSIQLKELPATKAISLIHIGPYETLPQAYEAIETYRLKNKLTLIPPWREVYIKGPGLFFKGNPKTYITELIFPIKDDNDDCY